uniref:lipid-binding SYLF domain-containing protein n=1 Tax=Roseivirga sp. TaxID=1964215 RepID=UPI0040486820
MKSIITSALIIGLLFSTQAFAQKKEKYDTKKAQKTISQFKKTDPGLNSFFDDSFGYVVFPSIGKGAIGIGGAGGKGIVYKQGDVVGGSKMTQITVGFQLGGQEYSEVIFFENADSFNRFINNQFQFAAQVSAVALKSGVSADAKYTDGVAVFTQAKGGLMYEASVGGQKFKFIAESEMK